MPMLHITELETILKEQSQGQRQPIPEQYSARIGLYVGPHRRRYRVADSGVTRVQMKPGQLPNTKLIIITIIVNFNWHLSYLVDLEVTFINSRVASWQL